MSETSKSFKADEEESMWDLGSDTWRNVSGVYGENDTVCVGLWAHIHLFQMRRE